MSSSGLYQITPNSDHGVNLNLWELQEKLNAAIDWLSTWGFSVSRTRIGQYQKFLESLVGKKLSELEYHSFMFDIGEILYIHSALCKFSDLDLRPLLADLVKGKARKGLIVGDERARNFEFELKTAAKFLEQGYKLNLSTNADLIATNNLGKQVLIECKRLTSKKQLKKRIKEASAQLHKKYKYCSEPLATRGFVCLDVSNLVNPEFKVIGTDESIDASKFLGGLVDDFANENCDLWAGIQDLRTWGVILCATAPVLLNEQLCSLARVYHVDFSVVDNSELNTAREFINHLTRQSR